MSALFVKDLLDLEARGNVSAAEYRELARAAHYVAVEGPVEGSLAKSNYKSSQVHIAEARLTAEFFEDRAKAHALASDATEAKNAQAIQLAASIVLSGLGIAVSGGDPSALVRQAAQVWRVATGRATEGG